MTTRSVSIGQLNEVINGSTTSTRWSASKTCNLVPHDNGWKFKCANVVVTRTAPQLQCYQKYWHCNATAVPSFSKYSVLVVEKNEFRVG